MYEYLLQTRIATLLVAVAVAWLAGALAGNPRVALRSIVFSYWPAFACAFFVIGAFYEGQVSAFDLAAGFLFEFSVLLAFTKLFHDALKADRGVDERAVELWLRWSFALQLLIALPLLTSEGFGIFSEGSRIAYLDAGHAAKYLTYAGGLLSSVQAGLIAKRLSGRRSPGPTGYAVIFGTFAVSTLSGSKGSFFLWLASTLALVNYLHLRLRWLPIVTWLIMLSITLVITAKIISEMLGITEIEFTQLAVSRFFLNNDARALAFDLRSSSGGLSDLLAASFRSLSTLLGHESIDPPLGLLLFEKEFGVSTGNGANASLIALITYYSMRGYAMFPTIIACLGLAVLYGGVVGFRRIVVGPLRKMAVTLIGLTLVQQLSQDFFAFQLLVPLACAAGFFFIVTNRKYAGASPRSLRPSARFAIPQHRHPGS